jgi:hypothetical protein
VVGHAGEIAVGEEGSPGGSHRPSGVASCRHRAVYEQKKVPVLPPHPQIARVQLPWSGAIPLQYSLFSRIGAFRSQQQGFSSVRGQDTSSASRLTPLPGFSRRFAGRVLLTNLSFSGESPEPRPPEQPGPVARNIASRPGDEQDPASSDQDHLGGDYRLRGKRGGQARVAVHEDEDLFVSEET